MLIHGVRLLEFALLELSITISDWTVESLFVVLSPGSQELSMFHLLGDFEKIPFFLRFPKYSEVPGPARR